MVPIRPLLWRIVPARLHAEIIGTTVILSVQGAAVVVAVAVVVVWQETSSTFGSWMVNSTFQAFKTLL